MTESSFFLVILLAGITLVAMGLGVALLISPKSVNFQKGEPYECGLPTHGTSWMQFRVGYYLYAILFLMFDVEILFLPQLGMTGLASIPHVIVILSLGLAYAWKKGDWNGSNDVK